MTVARAAPFTPMSIPKMKTGSRIRFVSAPMTVESIAIPGRPWALMKEFRPVAIWTNTVPVRYMFR